VLSRALPCLRRARPQIVAENDTHTAYLTHEALKELLENSLDATLQTTVNSKTDIVILGDLNREPEFADSKKGEAITKQCDDEKRKEGDIELVRFADFMTWSKLKTDIQASASVAEFDKVRARRRAGARARGRAGAQARGRER